MYPNAGEKGPSLEAPQLPEAYDSAQERGAEASTSHQESSPGKQAPQSSIQAQVAAITASGVMNPAAADDSTATTVPDTGLAVTDSDKIEKQWVEQAKAVIAQTREDPYRQKNEISKIKADYIKKRFKKIIKVNERDK